MEDVEDIYELVPMQHGMLFDSVNADDSGMYLMQLEYSLSGVLHVPDFERAWQQAVERHPILRTSFHWEGLEKPLQVVHKEVGLTLDRHDWSELAEGERDRRAASFREEDRQRGVDFEAAPLMRLALFREGPDAHRLLWSFHHILMEGWSAALVLRDVLALYRSITRGQSAELQEHRPYRDYVALLQQQKPERAEEFWRGELRGFQSPTHLGIDGTPTTVQSSAVRYGELQTKLSAESTEALRSFAKRHELTLNTVVQGAWAVMLSRYSGEEDVVMGTLVSGRSVPLEGIESMVGLTINILPSRVRVSPGEALVPWLRRLQSHQVRQREFEHSPLVTVKGWSEVPAGLPLFESMLVFENWLGDLAADEWDAELEVTDVRGFYFGAGHPLTAIVTPGTELGIGISYDRDRFEVASITRLLANLEVLLCGMVADPECCLADLPFLAAAERELQLSEWNATGTSAERGGCLHELFEEQVRRTPEAVAAILDHRSLDYRELDRRANQLAHHLRDLGVGPDVRVALYLGRSLDALVAILGILKAGGAYLPLDPDYPPERLRYVAQDAAAPVVITHAATRERMPDFGDPTVVCLDRDAELLAACSTQPPPSTAAPGNLAYVLYTSGSTGQPKGVAMPHAPLVNLMHWQFAQSSCDADSRTLQFAPFGFDVSCQELFATLGSGGTLYLVGDETRRDPAALLELLHERAINRIFVPFVALQQMAEAVKAGATVPSALREVITAGEQPQMNAAMVELFRRLPGCTLVNQYGPTECHVVSSWTLSGDPAAWPTLPPIGRPIDNATLYVVDRELRPVPIGAQGELLIGGACVARGYLERADLTAQRFVPDPFDARPDARPGRRLYRTGDLARYLPDGSLQLLGRTDHQVKVRGFRIELGEVEVTLGHHPDLSEVAVVAREDTLGVKRLVAYMVCPGETAPTGALLRSYLTERLPEYMVPSLFVRLDALPQTPSGKLDRRALPVPDGARPELEQSFLAPRNPLELQIAEIWQRVLGVDRVGVRDNFFDLGGHSLLLMPVVGDLKKLLGVKLSPGDLMLPTLGQLAALCETKLGGTPSGAPPPVQSAAGSDARLKPFYFGRGLLGCFHAPVAPARDTGLVLCYPLGHEYIQFHRSFRQLAMLLAEAGFPVLRFDFHGCGDSAGDHEGWRLERWVEDARAAADELRERAGVSKIALVGTRLGATVAALSAVAHEDVDALVLWDPVLRGPVYVDELRTLHENMVSYAHVTPRKNSGPEEILGFALPKPLLDDLAAVDLLALERAPAPRVLVIESNPSVAQEPLRSKLEGLDASADLQRFSNPHLWAWIEDFGKVHVPRQVLEAVVAWLVEGDA